MNDKKYWATRDGELVAVPPINELCLALKDKFLRQEEQNKRLREENEKLKNGIWEKEEIARLKADYDRFHEEWRLGFPITKEQREKINEWQKSYIGGVFTYKFVPTPIGVCGVCIAPNGDEFEFQEIS